MLRHWPVRKDDVFFCIVVSMFENASRFCNFRDDENAKEEIASLPNQFRYGVNTVIEALRPVVDIGLKSVLLFGVPYKLAKVSYIFMSIINNCS